MKKILLIAIAMIVMIGTAAANPSFIKLTPENIVIVPDGISVETMEVLVYDYNWDASRGDPQDRYLSGYSNSDDVDIRISVDGGSTWSPWTTSANVRVGMTYSVPSTIDEHVGIVEIRGTSTATLAIMDNWGTSYPVGGISYDEQAKYDVSSETPDVAVPEFPTIALPVAAILGLAFIFQRRREED